jgi:hypothetical protein
MAIEDPMTMHHEISLIVIILLLCKLSIFVHIETVLKLVHDIVL